jgi:3-deoxy-manno-octulosonate cytidylyltransferase (CMP-KDO synthetase)
MEALIVIPARFASTRFPGKPLVRLTGASGKSMTLIERSWRAARSVKGGHPVVVATDDGRIADEVRRFGGEVVMTSPSCRNGTERCAEVAAGAGTVPVIVNLQGDAPLTPPWFVEALIARMAEDPAVQMATPVLRCDLAAYRSFREDRAAGRVGGTTAVFGDGGQALYFSKEVIPWLPSEPAAGDQVPVFHHVGVYAYRPGALRDYAGWDVGPLEALEGLEQLRFLERGRAVLCVEVEARGRQFWELNNPSDVPKIEAMMREMGMA